MAFWQRPRTCQMAPDSISPAMQFSGYMYVCILAIQIWAKGPGNSRHPTIQPPTGVAFLCLPVCDCGTVGLRDCGNLGVAVSECPGVRVSEWSCQLQVQTMPRLDGVMFRMGLGQVQSGREAAWEASGCLSSEAQLRLGRANNFIGHVYATECSSRSWYATCHMPHATCPPVIPFSALQSGDVLSLENLRKTLCFLSKLWDLILELKCTMENFVFLGGLKKRKF